MSKPFNEEEMNLRKLRKENLGFNAHTIIQWWLIPGIIGILGSVFLGKIAVGMAMLIPRNESISRGFNRIVKELNEDVIHLFKFEWNQTDLWVYFLVGFLVGVVIKYAYSDEKIG